VDVPLQHQASLEQVGVAQSRGVVSSKRMITAMLTHSLLLLLLLSADVLQVLHEVHGYVT
jgi:hypothetical protein